MESNCEAVDADLEPNCGAVDADLEPNFGAVHADLEPNCGAGDAYLDQIVEPVTRNWNLLWSLWIQNVEPLTPI